MLLIPAVLVLGGTIIWRAPHYVESTYLVLNAGEVEYHNSGYTLRTTWDNIAVIAGSPVSPVLKLKEPVDINVSLFFRRNQTIDREIPLYPFDYSPQSDLAQDVRRFAPHLFA